MAVNQEGLRETACAPSRVQATSPKSSPQLLRFECSSPQSSSSSLVAPSPVPSPRASPRRFSQSTDSDVIDLPGDVGFYGNRNGGLRASVRHNCLASTATTDSSPKANHLMS